MSGPTCANARPCLPFTTVVKMLLLSRPVRTGARARISFSMTLPPRSAASNITRDTSSPSRFNCASSSGTPSMTREARASTRVLGVLAKLHHVHQNELRPARWVPHRLYLVVDAVFPEPLLGGQVRTMYGYDLVALLCP